MNNNKLSKFNKQLEIYQKYSKKLSNQDNHLILGRINKKIKKINKIILGGSDCSDLTDFQKKFDTLISNTNLVTDTMQNKINDLRKIIEKIIINDNKNLLKNIEIAQPAWPDIKNELQKKNI